MPLPDGPGRPKSTDQCQNRAAAAAAALARGTLVQTAISCNIQVTSLRNFLPWAEVEYALDGFLWVMTRVGSLSGERSLSRSQSKSSLSCCDVLLVVFRQQSGSVVEWLEESS